MGITPLFLYFPCGLFIWIYYTSEIELGQPNMKNSLKKLIFKRLTKKNEKILTF